MIPSRPDEEYTADSKPRASGDDPCCVSALQILAHVNPARAGMIPIENKTGRPEPGKPRASGDDPDTVSRDPGAVK